MKNVLFKFITSTPTKLQRVYIGISDDECKSSITITRNNPKANVIKMKRSSVVTLENQEGGRTNTISNMVSCKNSPSLFRYYEEMCTLPS